MACGVDRQDSRPVRVAYLVPPSQHFAGIERVTHELATGLAERGDPNLDISVIYFTDYPEIVSPPYRRIFAKGTKVRDVPAALHRVLQHNALDVVIIPQFEIAFLCIVYNRLRARRDPIVLHLHGNPDIERGMSFKSRLLFSFYNLSPRLFSGILAVSPGLAGATARELGGNAPIRYLPNPVRQLGGDTDRAVSNGKAFVSVGRLAYQKGHDVAIRAFQQVVAKHPDATLTILGDGPERAALQALIDSLELGNNVVLKGVVADPTAELRAADAFVIASRWEGFGVAIIEALSTGLPVIAARCDFGPADIITSPEIGTLVAAEDEAALADAILHHISASFPGSAAVRIAHAAAYERSMVAGEHASYLAAFAKTGGQ